MNRIARYLYILPIALAFLLAILPYLSILLASLKRYDDLFSRPILWFFQPTLNAYVELYNKGFERYLLNSVIVSSASTVLCLSIGTLAAYCFSRYKFQPANTCSSTSWLRVSGRPSRMPCRCT